MKIWVYFLPLGLNIYEQLGKYLSTSDLGLLFAWKEEMLIQLHFICAN